MRLAQKWTLRHKYQFIVWESVLVILIAPKTAHTVKSICPSGLAFLCVTLKYFRSQYFFMSDKLSKYGRKKNIQHFHRMIRSETTIATQTKSLLVPSSICDYRPHFLEFCNREQTSWFLQLRHVVQLVEQQSRPRPSHYHCHVWQQGQCSVFEIISLLVSSNVTRRTLYKNVSSFSG